MFSSNDLASLAASNVKRCSFSSASNITFFSGWKQQQLAGCVAIKTLDTHSAELKSMRTAKPFRRCGVASQLLLFALEHAKMKGFSSVSLETGTQDYFLAARTLYKKFGFVDCGPFGSYSIDPNSHFMTRAL